ncbi:MAG: hypothetical protein ER33_14615 [Cyanobium sp. CACIAM 14]|nr:MAG: hypothetical protein ER33_14615 [Cyanobium sp. CACIAM 14]
MALQAGADLRFDLEAKAAFHRAAGIGHDCGVDVLKPRMLRVLEPASAEPLLQDLRSEVDRLLTGILPA